MGTEGMIEITGADLRQVVAEAYALSSPQGMGFLHFEEGPLPDAEIDAILNRPTREWNGQEAIARMDYVRGRAVKFGITREVATGRMWIRDRWFDHSDSQLQSLLRRIAAPKDRP